jgi:DNA polymerase-3 subunit alpha
MTLPFIHLHVHTEHSPLDGLTRVRDLVRRAKDDGAPAVAITDHGSLNGWYNLHKAAGAAGVMPIYGCEAYLAIGSRHDPQTLDVKEDVSEANPEDLKRNQGAGRQPRSAPVDTKTKTKSYYHLTVLAETPEGFANLISMMNAAEDTYRYHPLIDYPLLKEHGKGLIVLTGCLGGPVAGPLSQGDIEGARRGIESLIEAVGHDSVYIEVMDHEIDAEVRILDGMRRLSAEFGLPMVVTNDNHFTDAEDHLAHEAWLCVSTGKTLDDDKRFTFNGEGYYYRTGAEMRVLHDEDWWQEACDATYRLALRIRRSAQEAGHEDGDLMPAPHQRLPKFPLPEGYEDSKTYFHDLLKAGALEKYGDDPARPGHLRRDIAQRMAWEEKVINGAGTADYFLILRDLIEWANSERGYPCPEYPQGKPGQKKPIWTGPGRGSAGGSCAAYVLGITRLDPLAHGLLFERFLDPSRIGLPDIDTDFEKERRQEILHYLTVRYGADVVARVGTFGLDKSRGAIKDAARTLNLDSQGEKLASAIPVNQGKPAPLSDVLDPGFALGEPFRRQLSTMGEDGDRLISIARTLEDVVRNNSTHACATIISDEPLDSLVPMYYERKKGKVVEGAPRVIGWEGGDLDAYGLLKLDVLGLITLDILHLTSDYVEQTTGERVDIAHVVPGDTSSPEAIRRDREAFRTICEGRTEGIFQLSSSGMRDLAMNVQPDSWDDLTALVALYRPGPMAAGMHTLYADRKNGRDPVSYDYLTTNPAEQRIIASVLDPTFGTIVYQEQIMQLGTAIGGLDGGYTNKLRKAFSKKKAELMAQVKEVMFAGALAGDNPTRTPFQQSTLDKLWTTFEASASYLFNKSHACGYGYVAYQTAYMKGNWPAAFAAAVLAHTGRDDKRSEILRSLTAEGITILAPDVNSSQFKTAPDGSNTVRFGLGEIKGVGAAAKEIIAEREARGPFTSLTDLMDRVNNKVLTTGDVQGLIEAGALDSLGGTRLGMAMEARVARLEPELRIPAEWGPFERDLRQRLRLGVTMGEHPMASQHAAILDLIRDNDGYFRSLGVTSMPPLVGPSRLHDAHDRDTLRVVGILTGFEKRTGKRSRFARIEVEGRDRSRVGGIMFQRSLEALEQRGAEPRIGYPVVVTGRVQIRKVVTERTTETGETVTEEASVTELVADSIDSLDVSANDEAALPARRPWRDPRSIGGLGPDVDAINPAHPGYSDADVDLMSKGTWAHPGPGGAHPAFVGEKASAGALSWLKGDLDVEGRCWRTIPL